MELSVVVSTLNGRERLASCLDALTARGGDVETIVVNGPSTDGTSGMVRDREDVDVLLEIADRNVNVARNAGLAVATGDVVAVIDDELLVEESWREALETAIDDGAAVVTGPTHRTLRAGMTTEAPESTTIGGRTVTFCNSHNVAFSRPALEAIDGYDEYLETGGTRDGAHRLAALDQEVRWEPGMSVRREYGADGGRPRRDWNARYRSLVYRLVKNYGLRPGPARRLARQVLADGRETVGDVLHGERTPTDWCGLLKQSLTGALAGCRDGLLARTRDRDPRRNPYGLSTRTDRVVQRHDWR